MQFTVDFRNANQARPIIRLGSDRLGLDWLDKARSTSNMPQLDASLVNAFPEAMFFMSVDIEVNEDNARASGLFTESCHQTVHVTEYLNNYVDLQPHIVANPRNGEIETVRAKRVIQYNDILSDWIAAGYPSTWDLNLNAE